MVDFAQRNAQRAGVASVIEFRGGDALQRMPPIDVSGSGGGVILMNPPYGERIEVGGVARAEANSSRSGGHRGAGQPRHGGQGMASEAWASASGSGYEDDGTDVPDASAQVGRFGARELPQTDNGGEFFSQLATHWKNNYAGWTAWMLTPDLKLPGKMRLKESRRVPMWNGPIECRLFRFDMVKGSARERSTPAPTAA
jgi:putative N6-adenine-specific DNA methylase